MVIGLQLAKATRLPMTAVESIEIETAAGILGDRYHGSRHRQVSVQSAEELTEAEATHASALNPLLTRRNITISSGRIPRDPGHRWTVGEVEVEVVRDAAPASSLTTNWESEPVQR